MATARALRGLTRIFASIRLNQMKIASPDALPLSMFTYGVPYEATEAYRTIRNEFESNKSMAILEARNALTRSQKPSISSFTRQLPQSSDGITLVRLPYPLTNEPGSLIEAFVSAHVDEFDDSVFGAQHTYNIDLRKRI